jgi:acyl carrier protein phosphodiesterase
LIGEGFLSFPIQYKARSDYGGTGALWRSRVMNWLAHLFLSEPTPAFRIGNLLPDILPPQELIHLGREFQRGIQRHRQIDAFTDSHPVVRRSILLIGPAYRRFGGILTDMFYDHFLASDWPRYSEATLEEFSSTIYASFEALDGDLPATACLRLRQIKAADLLCSYRDIDGIGRALEGMGRRLRRPAALGDSIAELERHYDALHADFAEFFPELCGYVAAEPV